MTKLSDIAALLVTVPLFVLIACLQRLQSVNNYLLLRSQQRGFQSSGAFTPESSALPHWQQVLQSALIFTNLWLGRLIDIPESLLSPLDLVQRKVSVRMREK